MHFGLHIPLFGPLSDPRQAANLAAEAEAAGWDGLFVWDHISPPWHPLAGDVTVSLAAMAASTSRIRLGPMVTPLARRRPQKLAREIAALDILSGGRITLGVGIGGFKREFDDFGDERDARRRSEMLDEALEVLGGLWSGEPYSFVGVHYHVREQHFLPTPVQRPRPPIWVAAHAGAERPLERAARWDGVFPTIGDVSDSEGVAAIREMVRRIRELRPSDAPFDVLRGGETGAGDAAADRARLEAYADAGVTWWIENLDPGRWGFWEPWPAVNIAARVEAGPPRLI